MSETYRIEYKQEVTNSEMTKVATHRDFYLMLNGSYLVTNIY